jgi:hypothetical protein
MATAIEPKVEGEIKVQRESFEALEARLLAGAAVRIRADIEEAQRLGIIDEHGNLLSDELPEDMQPGAQRDFGG